MRRERCCRAASGVERPGHLNVVAGQGTRGELAANVRASTDKPARRGLRKAWIEQRMQMRGEPCNDCCESCGSLRIAWIDVAVQTFSYSVVRCLPPRLRNFARRERCLFASTQDLFRCDLEGSHRADWPSLRGT